MSIYLESMVKKRNYEAFTIVELLVVIVIIGILASITIVSYSGISIKAKIASIQSDLSNASKQLRIYNVDNGYYPLTISTDCVGSPTSATNLCLKASTGNNYTTTAYTRTANTFKLFATNGNLSYYVTENSGPIAGIPFTCPTGFIIVPGSVTYGTSEFCVMKYEAKADGNGDGVGDTSQTTASSTWPADSYPISSSRKFVSSANGYPVANISQNTAITAAASANFVYNCPSGCRLISDAEWLTIAQNVLSVDSNWSGGVVGSGYIFSGHNDTLPNTALTADASDSNGYSGTEQSTPSSQRRTLTLTNGEVIWDFAGNLYEWTLSKTNGVVVMPGVAGAGWSWREWNTATTTGTLPVNPFPQFSNPLAGSWTSNTKGIGMLYSQSDNTGIYGFLRGGMWRDSSNAGVFSLSIATSPTSTAETIGLRITRP